MLYGCGLFNLNICSIITQIIGEPKTIHECFGCKTINNIATMTIVEGE